MLGLLERWQSYPESEAIWKKIIEWIDKQPPDSLQWQFSIGQRGRKNYSEFNQPVCPLPLRQIFKGKSLNIFRFNNGPKQGLLSIALAMIPTQASKLSTEAVSPRLGPFDDVTLYPCLLLGICADNETTRERSKEFEKAVWQGDLNLTQADKRNAKIAFLGTVFTHEFTHFRDLKHTTEIGGPKLYYRLARREETTDPGRASLPGHLNHYYNKPTEVNAHTNELLRTIDSLGMMPHINSADDVRRLSIHMLPISSGFAARRWLNYIRFVKRLNPSNRKKFIRRLRQYKGGDVRVRQHTRKGQSVRSYLRRKPGEDPLLPFNRPAAPDMGPELPFEYHIIHRGDGKYVIVETYSYNEYVFSKVYPEKFKSLDKAEKYVKMLFEDAVAGLAPNAVGQNHVANFDPVLFRKIGRKRLTQYIQTRLSPQ